MVAPNLPEAEALGGRTIAGAGDAVAAAAAIRTQGAKAVVLKGGHFDAALSTDYLCDAAGTQPFSVERVATPHTHDTGCAFASALATWLAQGLDLRSAVGRAKDYVTEAVRHGVSIGSGHGPTDHFFVLREERDEDADERSV